MDPEEFRKFFENGISQELYGAYRMLRKKKMDMDRFKDIVFRLEDITKHGTYTNLFPWGNRQEQTRTPTWKIQQRQKYGGQQGPSGYQSPRNDRDYSSNYRATNLRQSNDYQSPRKKERPAHHITAHLNTRTNDGRPRCYQCNRVGHYAAACRDNGNHPNANGRRQ
ncbi:hypothetical protein JTB14_006175 [Gonioctena quinquepunctata]|nr:hypothetical protein JTB14_006175 [Gonioctena quinquepunctata]